jgi:hypothetical protein
VARMVHSELGELLGLAVETEVQLKNRLNSDVVAGRTVSCPMYLYLYVYDFWYRLSTYSDRKLVIFRSMQCSSGILQRSLGCVDLIKQTTTSFLNDNSTSCCFCVQTIHRGQKDPFSFMSNFAFHHLVFVDMEAFREKSFNSSFYEFWRSRANPNQPAPNWNPRVKIFQATPFLYNDLNHWQNNEAYRRRVIVLKSMFMSLGFDKEIDQYLLNSGHFSYDYHYRGAAMRMTTMILMNLLCHA